MMSGSPEEAKAETLQWKKYSASKYRISGSLSTVALLTILAVE